MMNLNEWFRLAAVGTVAFILALAGADYKAAQIGIKLF